MKNNVINVVWCDDNIESLYNESRKELFANHNCYLYKKAKRVNDLKDILKEDKEFIDAVIVDFNVGENEFIPKEMSASGFQWIHKHLEEYSPLPFYLFSGRDRSFINKKYADYDWEMEGDYFFSPNENIESKRNRYYHLQDLDELLTNLEEEVSNICTPEFKIRQEYSKAFKVINKFNLEGSVFIDILLSNENIDRYKIIHKANPLRMVIENLISKLENENIIPEGYSLNKMHELLRGDDKINSIKYSSEHYMHASLADAFKFFIDYTQDGSHDKESTKGNNKLTEEFVNYLRKSKDIYIIKALAIICLDIIQWLGDFHNHYVGYTLFENFKPFETEVLSLKTVAGKEGAIVKDSEGRVYFVLQPTIEKYKYKVGSKVRVFKRDATNKYFGDYFAIGENLDVKNIG